MIKPPDGAKRKTGGEADIKTSDRREPDRPKAKTSRQANEVSKTARRASDSAKRMTSAILTNLHYRLSAIL